MNKARLIILCFMFALVASLVFSGGKSEEGPMSTEETGEPQYGGTLTLLTTRHGDPKTMDPSDIFWANQHYLSPYMEALITGDVAKYGPRGTNEFSFELVEYVPEGFMKGQLAESWEVSNDPPGVVFHIRQGVHWTGESVNPGVMKRREFTASDAAFWGNRYRANAWGTSFLHFMPEEAAFEVLDKYTVRANFTKLNAGWPLVFGYGFYAVLYPPESVDAGVLDWKNHVGTGPFILTNYTEGSSFTYRKNPDWWGKKQIVDGKTYDTPFIDKLVMPVIVDESTEIAALRTRKIDVDQAVSLKYEKTLASTSPDLMVQKYASGFTTSLQLSHVHGVTLDKNIRRALVIGLDRKALVRTAFIEGDVGSLPFNVRLVPYYTPIEELPASAQELFDYNPEKAAQMIADAGYPDGLKIELDYKAADAVAVEMVPLVADMWSKIGVEAKLQPREAVAYANMSKEGTYKNAMFGGAPNAKPIRNLNSWRTIKSSPFREDEYYNAVMDKAMALPFSPERTAMIKELAAYVIDNAYHVGIGSPKLLCYWWPWVKNYYGEIEGGYFNTSFITALSWIDQDVKAKY